MVLPAACVPFPTGAGRPCPGSMPGAQPGRHLPRNRPDSSRPQPVAVIGADERVPLPAAVQGAEGQDGAAVQPALAHGVHGVLRGPGHRGDRGALPVQDRRESVHRASRISGSPATTMRCATTRVSPATRPAATRPARDLGRRDAEHASAHRRHQGLGLRAACAAHLQQGGAAGQAAADRTDHRRSGRQARVPGVVPSGLHALEAGAMRSPVEITPQFRGRAVENDRGGFCRTRRAAAAHLRHGRRIVGLAAAPGNGARDRR